MDILCRHCGKNYESELAMKWDTGERRCPHCKKFNSLDEAKKHQAEASSLSDWLNADKAVNAYAYRVYWPDTDTITYELTLSKKEALYHDAYPIELTPTLLMRPGI